MYQSRFQRVKPKKIFNIKGRFKISYVGRGTFYYTIPGLKYPKVGKIELGRKKIKHSFLGAFTFLLLFLLVSNFYSYSNASPSVSEEDLERLEKEGRLDELEKKSEEAKLQLYTTETPTESIGNSSRVKIKKYFIKKGETISSIAKKHKIDEKYIYITSKLKDSESVKPGQEISIPERPGIFYKIKVGENISSILDKYKVKLVDMQADNPDLASMDIIEPGVSIFLPNAKIPTPNVSWFKPVIGRFTSYFGSRRHPILKVRHFHSGLDISISYKPVKAAKEGTVVYTGYLGAYGKVVMIRHDDNYKTLYGHLSDIKIKAGDRVKAGKIIAISGSTGRSTGPHLHYEVVRNGRAVNPCGYGYVCPRSKAQGKSKRSYGKMSNNNKKKVKSLN